MQHEIVCFHFTLYSEQGWIIRELFSRIMYNTYYFLYYVLYMYYFDHGNTYIYIGCDSQEARFIGLGLGLKA